MGGEGDESVVADRSVGPRAGALAILRAVGAALGTVSAAVLVIGVAVGAVVAVLGVGFWFLLTTFTTVGR
ncbi:MAG: hypothetical protein IRY85_20885 [Micromonosporaceae bacterium]|nr:hypothetical protein [Micromonosporaceae bacterium]